MPNYTCDCGVTWGLNHQSGPVPPGARSPPGSGLQMRPVLRSALPAPGQLGGAQSWRRASPCLGQQGAIPEGGGRRPSLPEMPPRTPPRPLRSQLPTRSRMHLPAPQRGDSRQSGPRSPGRQASTQRPRACTGCGTEPRARPLLPEPSLRTWGKGVAPPRPLGVPGILKGAVLRAPVGVQGRLPALGGGRTGRQGEVTPGDCG